MGDVESHIFLRSSWSVISGKVGKPSAKGKRVAYSLFFLRAWRKFTNEFDFKYSLSHPTTRCQLSILPIYLYFNLSVLFRLSRSVSVFVCLSICLLVSLSLSVCLSVCLSFCLSHVLKSKKWVKLFELLTFFRLSLPLVAFLRALSTSNSGLSSSRSLFQSWPMFSDRKSW